MNRFFMAAFAVSLLIASTPVEAKNRHLSLNHTHVRHVAHRHQPTIDRQAFILDVAALPAYSLELTRNGPRQRQEPMGKRQYAPVRYEVAQVIGGRPSGCPHRYCGCSASLRVFGRIIAELNLAANWHKFPSASPAPGMAAWRYGHVFIIESVNGDGTVVAHDGNSGGGLTRLHTVSLRGYHVVNPNGGQTFSARHREASAL